MIEETKTGAGRRVARRKVRSPRRDPASGEPDSWSADRESVEATGSAGEPPPPRGEEPRGPAEAPPPPAYSEPRGEDSAERGPRPPHGGPRYGESGQRMRRRRRPGGGQSGEARAGSGNANNGKSGQGSRRRHRSDHRKASRQEGIRDATASRMAAAQNRQPLRPMSGGPRRGNGRYDRVVPAPKRKGLEILKLLQQQVSIDPYQRFQLETTPDEVSMRVLDLIAPIGRGQRALIVSPPKAGKTTILTQVANALAINHPEVKVYALLVDERPEEVTHFRRTTQATVYAASSDMSTREHIATAEECVNTVVEPALRGEDVVLLLDSITRLARAYNTVQGNSGRTLSGGLDATTMLAPRQIFGAARKIEHGGSLTILGTALVDTGSRMDEVIFQEFKGTGNTELVLSRDLFEKRIFPCVDISKSGTRKEEKLYPAELVSRLHNLRRLAASYPPDKAMLGILKLMQRHRTNEELLMGLAGLE